MSKRPNPDRRAHIVSVALGLLEVEGVKGFGQVRVARAAGVQQGHLTYYFPRKSDLVRGVLEQVMAQTRAEFARLLERTHALGERAVLDALFERLRAMVKDRRRQRVMLALAVEAQDDPEVAALLDEVARTQAAAFAFMLGRPPDDVDVHLALATVRGLGVANLARGVTPRETGQVLDRLRQVLTTGR